jgi:hypothetical protein
MMLGMRRAINLPKTCFLEESKIAVLSECRKSSITEKDIQEKILILIHMLGDDLEMQKNVKYVFENIKEYGQETLETFFNLMLEKDYQTIFDLDK